MAKEHVRGTQYGMMVDEYMARLRKLGMDSNTFDAPLHQVAEELIDSEFALDQLTDREKVTDVIVGLGFELDDGEPDTDDDDDDAFEFDEDDLEYEPDDGFDEDELEDLPPLPEEVINRRRATIDTGQTVAEIQSLWAQPDGEDEPSDTVNLTEADQDAIDNAFAIHMALLLAATKDVFEHRPGYDAVNEWRTHMENNGPLESTDPRSMAAFRQAVNLLNATEPGDREYTSIKTAADLIAKQQRIMEQWEAGNYGYIG